VSDLHIVAVGNDELADLCPVYSDPGTGMIERDGSPVDGIVKCDCERCPLLCRCLRGLEIEPVESEPYP
jgi:hypothetical protein